MQKEIIKFLLIPRRVNGRWHWLKKARLLLKYDRTLTQIDAQTGDEIIIGRLWDIVSVSNSLLDRSLPSNSPQYNKNVTEREK